MIRSMAIERTIKGGRRRRPSSFPRFLAERWVPWILKGIEAKGIEAALLDDRSTILASSSHVTPGRLKSSGASLITTCITIFPHKDQLIATRTGNMRGITQERDLGHKKGEVVRSHRNEY